MSGVEYFSEESPVEFILLAILQGDSGWGMRSLGLLAYVWGVNRVTYSCTHTMYSITP